MGERPSLLSESPVLIYELTSRCNLRCVYCYNFWHFSGHAETSDELSDLSSWRRVLESSVGACLELGLSPMCYLSGGEPTVSSHFREVAELILGMGVPLVLITNLQAMTSDLIDELVPRLSMIEVTVLSARPKPHDELVGIEGAWRRTVERLIEIRTRTSTPVYVNFVLTARNWSEFRDVYLLSVSLGVKGMMLNRFNPGGRGLASMSELMPSREEVLEVLEQARDLVAEYALPVHVGVPIPPCIAPPERYPGLSFGYCPLGTDKAYYAIGPDGKLRPCNHLPIVLGDLREETLPEILTRWEETLRRLGDDVPPACRGCDLWQTCRGGCRAAGYVMRAEPGELSLAYDDPILKHG